MTMRVNRQSYLQSGLTKAMLALEHEVHASGLERPLLELVKIRASQLNGCACKIAAAAPLSRATAPSNR